MIEILKQFSKKSVVGILLSSSFIKLINLLVIVFVVKLLDQDEYGNIGYAQGVLNFIFPFIGMGASQSLLLFAGKTDSFSEKNQFFTSAFIYGGIISIFIGVLAILFSSTLSSGLPLSQNYIILLSFNFISLFIYDLVKAFSRVLETHQLYIRMEYLYGILTILSTLILSTLFGGLGYVVALIISPLFVGLFFLFYLIKKLNLKLNFDKKLSFGFWKYGIYESIGIASAQILFSIDIVNIGSILHSANDVAGYKIASLIPFSLAVIPNSFLTTDYVKIVQNRSNKEYLKTLIFG